MKVLSPVVWTEGMHLSQHHFQAQARYLEDATVFCFEAVRPRGYGFTTLDFDEDALANGSVVVLRARGIMPDGLVFDFPADSPPSALDVRERFSPTRNAMTVYLSLPSYRTGRPNCDLEGERSSEVLRYGVRVEEQLDETSGLDPRPVELAAKHFRLRLEDDSAEETVSLAVARVVRAGSGAFSFDPMFIPPALQLGGSARLVVLLRRFIEVLEQRAFSLKADRARSADEATEYAAREIMGFWLSHCVHSTLAVLRHLFETRTASTEGLYLELARLAGALCTFSMELDPSEIPAYEHDDLGRTFHELEQFIRRGLDVVLPRGAARIALLPVLRLRALTELKREEQGVAQFVWIGDVRDATAYERGTEWYLGVRCRLTAGETSKNVPQSIKICAEAFIYRLAQSAHGGMTLQHVATPPGELSPRADTQYFRIIRSGPCWDKIQETKQVGAFAPASFPDLELDVFVVPPTKDLAGVP